MMRSHLYLYNYNQANLDHFDKIDNNKGNLA